MYKDRVAIQLPNRVVIYQLDANAGDLDMQYHSAAKINKKLECNLLVVTSQHIVLCQVGEKHPPGGTPTCRHCGLPLFW